MARKCNTCGAPVPDNATVCPYCGNSIGSAQPNASRGDEQESVGKYIDDLVDTIPSGKNSNSKVIVFVGIAIVAFIFLLVFSF